jgi:prepilin-type N-terminal cleavage/methylation domain-containing protein
MKELRSERGITLVELVVVLVILGMVGAAIYPLLGNLLDLTGAKGASEEVAGAIRLARQNAITRGQNFCVQFTGTSDTTFEIKTASDDNTCDGAPAPGVVYPARGIGHQLAVVTPPNRAIVFNPVGNARNFGGPTQLDLVVGKDATSCPRMNVRVTLYGGVQVTSVC